MSNREKAILTYNAIQRRKAVKEEQRKIGEREAAQHLADTFHKIRKICNYKNYYA